MKMITFTKPDSSNFKSRCRQNASFLLKSEELKAIVRSLNCIFIQQEISVLVISSDFHYDLTELRDNTGANIDFFIFDESKDDLFERIKSLECGVYNGVIFLGFFGFIENDQVKEVYEKISKIVSEHGVLIFDIVNSKSIIEQGFTPQGVHFISTNIIERLVFENEGPKTLISRITISNNSHFEHKCHSIFVCCKKFYKADNVSIYTDLSSSIPKSVVDITEQQRNEIALLRNEIKLLKSEIFNLSNSKITRENIKNIGRVIKNWLNNIKISCKELRERNKRKNIYVDVSQYIHTNSRTGIQRVLKNIIENWMVSIADRVKLVYSYPHEEFYRLARFSCEHELKISDSNIEVDEIVHFKLGEIFIGLDFQPEVTIPKKRLFKELQDIGVSIQFVVYDLLPIKSPQYFPNTEKVFEEWLEVISHSDRVHCISKTVMNDYIEWLSDRNLMHSSWPQIDYFHLGSNGVKLSNNDTTEEKLTPYQRDFLSSIFSQLNFVMVGTVEPRKGHAIILSTFESLWQKYENINLIIVGKKGWMSDDLVKRIVNNPNFGKRLIWLEGITDFYLSEIYKVSTALIAASYDEGFGLPIIESANNNIPVIARDISIFREVADDGAFYFPNTDDPKLIECAIENWIKMYNEDRHPKAKNIPVLSWEEVSDNLLQLVI